MQVPSNMLLNYMTRPSLYLSLWIIVWGLVSASTSQVKTYGGIVACRFILGFVGKDPFLPSLVTEMLTFLSEAPFFAGVLFYLSKWYTKKEVALRMSIFYSGSLLSGAFGNLIAAGILSGLSTCFVGLILCFILPDYPHTWHLLSPEMKNVANRRMALDAAEADIDDGTAVNQLEGIKMAFTDPKTYILAFMYMCINASASFQNFFPTLTATLGYDHTTSLLLVAPPYIFMVFYSIAHNFMSDRIGNRFLVHRLPYPYRYHRLCDFYDCFWVWTTLLLLFPHGLRLYAVWNNI